MPLPPGGSQPPSLPQRRCPRFRSSLDHSPSQQSQRQRLAQSGVAPVVRLPTGSAGVGDNALLRSPAGGAINVGRPGNADLSPGAVRGGDRGRRFRRSPAPSENPARRAGGPPGGPGLRAGPGPQPRSPGSRARHPAFSGLRHDAGSGMDGRPRPLASPVHRCSHPRFPHPRGNGGHCRGRHPGPGRFFGGPVRGPQNVPPGMDRIPHGPHQRTHFPGR